ncbi:MAG: TGS domain-containing protein [Acidobacteria bacterium]|nr:TGS domain-containing protein [Acidobacteriota bacterium]
MPANLTPQYLAAEKRFKEAATTQEKIEALEEMMATIPKHKGTEKMRADLRRRMAKLNAEQDKRSGTSRASALFTVQREGAGQVVIAGAPSVGKSSLLAKLTRATPQIGDYPFTTQLPQPGMMPFENIQIQLVDMPPIAREVYKPWMGGILRQADLTLLVVDLASDDLLDAVDGVIEILAGSRIRLIGKEPPPEEPPSPGPTYCRTLCIANKVDEVRAEVGLQILREFYDPQFEIVPVSAASGAGLDALPGVIFDQLQIIRVHTKAPGKKPDQSAAPYVLKRGSTVLDVAGAVHRDFVHSLKYARVWSLERSGKSLKYDGQMVEKTYRLEDGDILELHV